MTEVAERFQGNGQISHHDLRFPVAVSFQVVLANSLRTISGSLSSVFRGVPQLPLIASMSSDWTLTLADGRVLDIILSGNGVFKANGGFRRETDRSETKIMSMLTAGQALIVTKSMPCQRESNARRATIHQGQQIVIQKLDPVSESVRFSVLRAGQDEPFTALRLIIEQCCAPAVPKAE